MATRKTGDKKLAEGSKTQNLNTDPEEQKFIEYGSPRIPFRHRSLELFLVGWSCALIILSMAAPIAMTGYS